jgi:hypothetical protein
MGFHKLAAGIQIEIKLHTCNSHPSVSLSLVDITGRTKLSQGISETRENRKIAASKDWKNILAPAKKKFPMLPLLKQNLSLGRL